MPGAVDMGGEDGTQVAVLVEDLNEVKNNVKKLADMFTDKPSAANAKKFNTMTFYIKGKPKINGKNANRRQHVGSDGMMRTFAKQWMPVLTIFVLCLGTLRVWASSPTSGCETLWQGFNLWAAFTHYALDGVIWKSRRPETAMALGA